MAPHKPIAPAIEKRYPIKGTDTNQSAVGGFWMTGPNMKATLTMRNGLKTDPLTVTPVLYLANGVRYALPAVTLQPTGIAIVDINQGLAQQGVAPYATLSGYVELDYQWAWPIVCAMVKSVDTVHSVIFNYGMTAPLNAPPSPGRIASPGLTHKFEGMWWKQEANVTGFVALSNISEQTINATMKVTDDKESDIGDHTISVSPHGTKVVNLSELALTPSTVGGVYLTYAGPEHGLVANGALEDDAVGYSARLPINILPQAPTDGQPPAALQVPFAELGLMNGAADPMMNFPAGTSFTPYSVIRNVSNQVATATPTIWWMAGGAAHSAVPPQITLSAHQTSGLNIPSSLASAGLKDYNGSLNVILDTKAPNGGLVFASGSVDQKNTYVFDVLPSSIAESSAKTISNWSTGNGDDTMVTVWNPADEAQDFTFTLFYAGGQYLHPIHLEPRATLVFDVSELTRNPTPDAAGNVVPAGVYQGSAEISGNQSEQQHILVGMDVGIYNVQKATCTWPCPTCHGWYNGYVSPNSFLVSLVGQAQLTFYMQYDTGDQYSLNGSSAFASSATNIATVDNSGIITGVSGGSVTASAHSLNTEPVYVPNDCNSSCPSAIVQGSATGNVYDYGPTVEGINPASWKAGGPPLTVTFSGTYFGTNAPTITFSPASGISYTLSSYSDNKIVAIITVAASTPNEDVSVTVKNNGYGGTAFYGGPAGQSPTSAPVYASVHSSPANSKEITVIAWVNASAPDLANLVGGANPMLVAHLNGGSLSCALEVGAWSYLMSPVDILNDTDRVYADAWLLKYSANPAPPTTITPSVQLSAGNYRAFNDFGNGQSSYQLGITPDPCGLTGVPKWILDWSAADQAQPSPYNGSYGTSPSGKVYQLVEGRVGLLGQAGSQTINNRTVAWIWSVIEFDSSGNATYSDHAIFPTYSVYVNGVLTITYPQSSVASFVALDQTSQRIPSQIP